MPIVTNKKYRYTFESYTRYLKTYAEQKYFSNYSDVKEFAENVRLFIINKIMLLDC